MWGRTTSAGKTSIPHVHFKNCPAKTYLTPDGQIVPGRNVYEHCLIVGRVAEELLCRFDWKRGKLLLPKEAALVAAVHDIGKVSPCFYEKIRRSLSDPNSLPATIAALDPKIERNWDGHAGCSHIAAKALSVPNFIPEILGNHHGFSPAIQGYHANDEVFGGSIWQEERKRLVLALQNELGNSWPEIDSYALARVIGGLTTVADWIGSGEFFEDPSRSWTEKIEQAVDSAGFVQFNIRENLGFEEVFGFKPNRIQSLFTDQVVRPGVYVLEAPMGKGKTEAALYAAYLLLAQSYASGIYFALPTQLTSNKILERFNKFLERILSLDCPHRALLVHSEAWLYQTVYGEDGQPGGSWFNQSKRGLLAPFGVGTIDQALMSCMNVKHGFVRTFGLAGKIVILDEVHTYDSYTGTILDALVEQLTCIGCTVIILSATLSKDRKEKLLQHSVNCDDYPLISSISTGLEFAETSIDVCETQKYDLRLFADETTVVEIVLERAERGDQVLWIENTVTDSQDKFLEMAARAAEIGVECGLLHSRFTRIDRAKIEERWVGLYSKGAWEERVKRGRILVGTQVLEQSLDIDADYLVSRFAPSDLLLQRIGRLWRHIDTPRPSDATPTVALLAPELESAIANPQNHFGKSARVYSAYVLCRSLEVFSALSSIRIPADLRSIIENTYRERKEVDFMARWLYELHEGSRFREGIASLTKLAEITLAESGKTLPESKAQTRYGTTESTDVLLLRNLRLQPQRKSTQLVLLDGAELELPWSRSRLSAKLWRELSIRLMSHIVSVPSQFAPAKSPMDTLKKAGLHNCFYLGNSAMDEAVLRVALVSDSGRLSTYQMQKSNLDFSLEYRGDLGYRNLSF
ncbi:MAG: CRISPR-associated helicase Cas3' [Deltaproteobacteria bacterium]|nr:CRISPR-associated helicase Cas3' [Deltaproteobacteria bacterium]